MEGLRVRTMLAILGVAIAIVWVMPNVFNLDKTWWPSKSKLNYGLDIQGGLHLVMGVDVDGVVTESVQRLALTLKPEMEKEGVAVSKIETKNPTAGEMEIH